MHPRSLMKGPVFLLSMYLWILPAFSQTGKKEIDRFSIGTESEPETSEVRLTLEKRFQSYQASPKNANDFYDIGVNSPKSAIFTLAGDKFYVNSLEGYTTLVYDARTFKKLKEIRHVFREEDSALFLDNESSPFDYRYRQTRKNYNLFMGKPVESCFSHQGRYLWITYYRRDFDPNAESPSAVAIIDTEKDSIVRVMPTGPLPKMIACSPDNRYIAVTHWGDNTVGIIHIDTDTVQQFRYVAHCIIDNRAVLNFAKGKMVNRDQECGNCLRGTVFTPDSKFLLVGKMGGAGGIAVIGTDSFNYLGTVVGTKKNLRHMVIHDGYLYLSSNGSGFVQRTLLHDFIESIYTMAGNRSTMFDSWDDCYVGPGARTIDISSDGKYIFACVNNLCKIAVIRAKDMKLISTIGADAYPVGMALSPDDSWLVVTSQGKAGGGGNSVMVYKVRYP